MCDARLLILAGIPLWIGLSPAWGGTAAPELRDARIRRLQFSLLAPCCYSEPVAQHQSEVAARMRSEIRNWVDEGRTDEEILATYRERYGTRVFIEPQGQAWWWTNLVPCVLIIVCTLGLVYILRHLHLRAAPPPPTAGIALPAVPESEDDWLQFEQAQHPELQGMEPGCARRRH